MSDRDTPIGSGTAGDSTAFSKHSKATRFNMDNDNMVRPGTEFLPHASQDFSEKLKPGRLRPIRNKSKSGQAVKREKSKKFNNVAENYLNEHTEKQQAVLKAKRKELADLDADMQDFMHVATDGNFNLKILNDAFEGRAHENEEIDLVTGEDGEFKIKKRQKRPPAKSKKPVEETKVPVAPKPTASGRDPRLDAIVEEVMRRSAADFSKDFNKVEAEDDMESKDAYSMALVPIDEAKIKRERNERLKKQAKEISVKTSELGSQAAGNPVRSGKVIFDVDGDDDGTFVTGVGIPGKSKKKKAAMQIVGTEKFYAREEDELLDRVNNAEADMMKMMKYLDNVEDMMGGDDLAHIRRMLNVTSGAVKHHSSAYGNIKTDIEAMNAEASSAMGDLARYNDDIKRMLLESE